MRIKQLELHAIRNVAHAALELGDTNLFVGPNGSGKTSVLEAVHLLAHGRSFRGGSASSLIRRDEPQAVVRAIGRTQLGEDTELAIARSRSGSTTLKVNGDTAPRIADSARLLPVQTLLPGVSELVFGAPGDRRAWLDWGLFHVEPDYFDTLRRFQRALSQRNAVLRSLESVSAADSALGPWEEAFLDLAEAVSRYRADYVKSIERSIVQTLEEIMPGMAVSIAYRTGWKQGQSLRDSLVHGRDHEVKLGVTRFGPHRGDLDLRCDDYNAAATLSRGQGKVTACLMKLVQAQHVSEITGRPTVLLVDDLAAELDSSFAERVFTALASHQGQVLVTATDAERSGWRTSRQDSVFHVEHGAIKPA